ncbi:hypothetical protein GCM10027190_32520 [Spirosoma areae]
MSVPLTNTPVRPDNTVSVEVTSVGVGVGSVVSDVLQLADAISNIQLASGNTRIDLIDNLISEGVSELTEVGKRSA